MWGGGGGMGKKKCNNGVWVGRCSVVCAEVVYWISIICVNS